MSKIEIVDKISRSRGRSGTSVPWWYLWVGRCNDHVVLHQIKSPLQVSNDCSESGTVWGLSGKVS
jgi:hypothetical protein